MAIKKSRQISSIVSKSAYIHRQTAIAVSTPDTVATVYDLQQ
nr:hypothetical protein [Pedobacter sp. ASV19]